MVFVGNSALTLNAAPSSETALKTTMRSSTRVVFAGIWICPNPRCLLNAGRFRDSSQQTRTAWAHTTARSTQHTSGNSALSHPGGLGWVAQRVWCRGARLLCETNPPSLAARCFVLENYLGTPEAVTRMTREILTASISAGERASLGSKSGTDGSEHLRVR